MTTYLKNKKIHLFVKILNDNEALQVTKEKHCIGIAVLSHGLILGEFVKIEKDEFIAAYSEVKRELINHNVLQEEEKEVFLMELFQQWADTWFSGLMGVEIVKEAAIESMKSFSPKTLGLLTSNMFKKQIKAWCFHNNYSFEDRIMKLIQGKTTEHIRVAQLH